MRTIILSLFVAVVACAHQAPPPPSLASASAAAPEGALLTQLASMVDAAERLCSPLLPRDQRDLGFFYAQKAFAVQPPHKAAAMALARCAHLEADWAESEDACLKATEVGTTAALAAGASDDAQAAYLYALSLGLRLRSKGLTALALLPDLIAFLKRAGHVPDLDEGGPLRVLGLLYVRAPPWPAGPGDLDAGLELLSRAAKDYPDHPANHLFYAEALIENGDKAGALSQLQIVSLCAVPALWGDYALRWQKEAAELARKIK